MSIREDVIALLRCPTTGQTVSQSEASLVVRMNKSIDGGRILDDNGQPVADRVDALLIREDGAVAYCVRDDIADMTPNSSVRLDQI